MGESAIFYFYAEATAPDRSVAYHVLLQESIIFSDKYFSVA